jgi:hypothetical protein
MALIILNLLEISLRTSDTIKVTAGRFARALGSFWYATELGQEMLCGMVVYIFEGFGV